MKEKTGPLTLVVCIAVALCAVGGFAYLELRTPPSQSISAADADAMSQKEQAGRMVPPSVLTDKESKKQGDH